MLPPVLLLMSLLMGSVEVNAAPFDKGSRQEEMMTRCIIEVLSNALAKPNAPPIDQECKEILRKSNRHNQDEEEGELKQYETRTIKDPVGLENHQHDSKEEAKQSPDLPKEEYEEKRHHAETESREEKEQEKLKETEEFDEKEESTGHSKERDFAEGEDDDEERDHKEHYEKEDMEKRNKYHEDSQESAHDILDKRAHHTAKHTKELPEEETEDDVKNLEEILKRHALSKNGKEQLLQPEKFHSIHYSKVPEENDGWEEEKEKISYKPNHEELIKRLFGYEERQGDHEEPRNDLADPRGQKPHFGETSLENHLIKNYFEKRSHYDKESLEEAREKKHHHHDSEEEAEHHDSSEESHEKEPTDHHHEEKRRQEERKRWPSQQNSRLNYEESNEDSEESEEGIDKRNEHEQEKENFYRKLKNHLQGSEEAEPFRQEKKQDEKRYYIGEEMVDGMKRYYPKLPQEDLRQYEESKNRHIREDREESNLPDIDTYTCLWGKKKFLEDLRRRYGGNRNTAKMPKLEEKREYDRMDELAQLLNYKKKSVEFPDFYDSEEIKKRHYDERGRFRETPLTEEEEKELENLAIMDLELQKIAEKLSNNRQG